MKNVISVTLGCIVLALSATRVAAQVKISAMAQDLQPVKRSSDVRVIRFGAFAEEDAVATEGGQTVLNAGDEVRCVSGKTSVELTSADGTSTTLSDPFRVVVLPTRPGRPHWINILKGNAQVVSERPTSIMIGETTLGTRGTRYGVHIERRQQEVHTEISVYEGEVRLSRLRLGTGATVETGRKIVLTKTEPHVVPLQAVDFERAAAIYATIDTVKSNVAREPEPARKKAFEELETRYMTVLREPDNPVGHRNLAVAQLNLVVPARAMYSLNRAAPPEPQPKEAAVVDLLKSIAYNQLGNSIEARRFRESAVEKDPSVNKTENLRLYRIDPRLITKSRLTRLQPIIVRAQVRPSKVAPSERTQIVVSALTSNGKPIRDADVVIKVGGGFFAGTDKREVNGRTDAQGNFTATWWCEPCAAAYGFYIEVSKRGFEPASTQEPTVEIVQ